MLSDKELGTFVRDHEGLLYAVAWEYFRKKNFGVTLDDVQEAVSEALYRIVKYKDKYSPIPGHKHPLETWASVIVRQSCYKIMQDYTNTHYQDYALPAHARTLPSPEASCVARETIVYHWEQLNPSQRRVIWLRYQGLDEHEIGFELGLTNIQVKSILSSARRKANRHEDRNNRTLPNR